MNHLEYRALMDRIGALEQRVADLEASATAPVEAAGAANGALPPRKPGRPPKHVNA